MNIKNITILQEYPLKDYTIINRHTKYLPIVACWNFCKENNTWSQGHYFETIEDACKYVDLL